MGTYCTKSSHLPSQYLGVQVRPSTAYSKLDVDLTLQGTKLEGKSESSCCQEGVAWSTKIRLVWAGFGSRSAQWQVPPMTKQYLPAKMSTYTAKTRARMLMMLVMYKVTPPTSHSASTMTSSSVIPVLNRGCASFHLVREVIVLEAEVRFSP